MSRRKQLVVVGCGKTKRRFKCPAKDLYTGTLFKAARTYAERHGDFWVIASAQHGLVDPAKGLEPYERVLKGLHPDLIKQWGAWCQCDLIWIMERMGVGTVKGPGGFSVYDNPPDVVMLAGKDYIEPIKRHTWLSGHPELIKEPLAGLGIGERISWLKARADGPVQTPNTTRRRRAKKSKARRDA